MVQGYSVLKFLTLAVATIMTVSGCRLKCTVEGEFEAQSIGSAEYSAPTSSSGQTVRLGTTVEKGSSTDELNVSGFSMDLDLNNAVLDTNYGTFTANVQNGTRTIATRQFQFYVQGNRLHPSNPSAIESWLRGFDGRADRVKLSASVHLSPANSGVDSGSVANHAVYEGQTYASAYTTLSFGDRSDDCQYDCEIR